MPTSSVLKEVGRSMATLELLGQDQGSCADNLRAALCFALHVLGDKPDSTQWPFPSVDFDPSEDYRENLVTAAAYMVCAIESGDRDHHKERKAIVAAQDNAEARFSTVRPHDEIKIKHKGLVAYHGQVAEDGYISLNDIRLKAAGMTQGELAAIIMGHLGLKEE